MLCIADKGYQWLELAPKDGNYVLTAMFRENRIFQIYIDITSKNIVSENGDAIFYDIFLDIVIKNGQIQTIDDNELEEALSQNVINYDEYMNAKNNAKTLVDFYVANEIMLEQKLYEYLMLFSNR